MAIKCGSCGDYHPNVQAVRGCHLARGVIKTQNPPFSKVFADGGSPKVGSLAQAENALDQMFPVLDMGEPVDPDDYNEFDALAAAFPRDEARRVEPFKPKYEPRGENFLVNSAPSNPTLDPAERVYLSVPFSEKNEAKALLGCKWDATKKAWWVPPTTDLSKAEPHWLVKPAAPDAANRAFRRTVPAADGVYKVDQGNGNFTIYKVQTSHYGDSNGFSYAKELVLEERTEAEMHPDHPEWTHKGKFVKAKGMQFKLEETQLMSHSESVQYGQLYGFCVRCGAILENEDSIKAGMGPICRNK